MNDHSSPRTRPASPVNLARREDQEDSTDVMGMHAAIMREQGEPKEGQEPLSLWLITLMSALLFWGGYYLQRYSGGYKSAIYNEQFSGAAAQPVAVAQTTDLYTKGKRLYEDTCGKCHQPDGQGKPGLYPPLAGSDWVLAEGPARVIRIVLDGLQGPVTVNGSEFNNPDSTMTPFRDSFTDEQIAAILTFERGHKEWGHKASEVKPEQVAAIREKTKDHANAGQYKADELLKIPVTEQ